ncbi:Mannitol-specific cryptic phosphotransferase enzyme IIA component [Raoultella planticola]|uniref:Mannitol-specific cryptic phosphotransferase enzyme IIA component n=1 Tax=Raoultella planticola TaxID=575 RepID=A0A485BI89_RAOPL|nr:Mannitol-specific cryptic phosphotransferase enzyme IIA component [Raoultella planticola]
MTIKDLLIEADAIQVGVMESDWRKVIELAASPLVANGYISESYSKAVIDNTLNHGAYYVFEEGLPFPMPDRSAGEAKLLQSGGIR